MNGPSLYHEEQRISQWWVWATVLVVVGLAWWALIQQVIVGRPFGDEPLPDWGVWLFWGVVGVCFPLGFLQIKMVVDVTSQEVLVRYRPFLKRRILLVEIESALERTYSPMREYGGWGIKGWSRRNIAYNVAGDRGVQLVLRDGRRVLIGSQRPEELARAIERVQ